MNIKPLVSLLAIAIAPFAIAEGDDHHDHKGPGDGHHHEAGKKVAEKAGVDQATMAKIKAAHEAAAKDPEVIKAREAAKAAMEAAKKAHHAAMIKADPSIADALAKIEKAREARESHDDCKDCDEGDKGPKAPKGKMKAPKGAKKADAPAAE